MCYGCNIQECLIEMQAFSNFHIKNSSSIKQLIIRSKKMYLRVDAHELRFQCNVEIYVKIRLTLKDSRIIE
jgi:ribosomal protein L14